MTYSFKFGGRQGTSVELEVADDLVAVRTRDPGAAPRVVGDESKKILNQFSLALEIPEANVQVLEARASGPDATKLRDEARRILKRDPTVRFAGRTLRDARSGAPVVYTENFFVKFREDLSLEECEALLKKHGLGVKQRLSYAKNAFFAEAPEGTGLDIFRIANALLDHDTVELAHPEIIREARRRAIAPQQWHLQRTEIGGSVVDAHVNTGPAWAHAKGRGVTIAVIDDGIDVDHEEFAGKVVSPRDVTLQSDDPKPKTAGDNHGTACAGVACAAGRKASGVAPEARLMPIRNVSNLGSQREAEAFVWAADRGADVISCSWGPADGEWWNPNDARHEQHVPLPDSTRLAIEYALTRGRGGKGCVICWAAGNGNESVDNDGYASHPGVIAVAACNDRGKRSVYSDFGNAVLCAFPSNDFGHAPFGHPPALTPGIWTTDRAGRQGYNPGALNPFGATPPGDEHGNYTHDFGGTSSACPGVAGIAALILEVNSDLTWREVRDVLVRSCVKIDAEGGGYGQNGHSRLYGYGRLDATAAVELARAVRQDQPEGLKLGAEARGRLEAQGAEELFHVRLPAPAVVLLDGPDGADFDLYIRRDQRPTTELFDARGYTAEPDESLRVSTGLPGDYFIMVRSYAGHGPFTLKVELE